MCWRFIQKTYRYNKINQHTGCQSLPVRSGFKLASQIYPLIICHQSHRSGAGHVTTLIYIIQGSRPYRSGTGLQLPSYTHRFPLYFVTNSHRPSTGHVTTQIYILQGSRAYRSGTGLQLPPYAQISSLFCHQFPPVRSGSCDNADTGPQSVRYWLQLPI